MKNKIVNNCTVVELHGKKAFKFAEYVLKNWDEMPCFRGNIVHDDYYHGVFFTEAYEHIIEFMKNEKIKFNESGNFIQFTQK